MAKVIDITDKLSFDGNPCLKIQGVELEVNADAETVLRLMGELSSGVTNKKVLTLIDMILPETSREKLRELHLSFADYRTMLAAAINLATDAGEDNSGEAQTHTTT